MGSFSLILSMLLAAGLTAKAAGATPQTVGSALSASSSAQAAKGGTQKPAPTFSGLVRLPVDLYTAEGTHLEKGEYTVQVKLENGQYSLLLVENDKTQSTIKGELLKGDVTDEPIAMPLMGTQFLRSSADPVGSEAERHFSKSGLPQYEEENRDWKAALRAYSTRDEKEALWFFDERQPGGKWSHVEFKVYLNPR